MLPENSSHDLLSERICLNFFPFNEFRWCCYIDLLFQFKIIVLWWCKNHQSPVIVRITECFIIIFKKNLFPPLKQMQIAYLCILVSIFRIHIANISVQWTVKCLEILWHSVNCNTSVFSNFCFICLTVSSIWTLDGRCPL